MSQSLRGYLESQADCVENVLSAHRTPGRITGGTVGPRLIKFFLNPAPHIRYSAIRRLADDLALSLKVGTLRVNRGKEGIILAFDNPKPRPVTLLKLLPEILRDEHGSPDPVPLSTALLGLTDDGVPLLARLSSPEVSHILISGTTGSGKSVLLRTIALSLILTHRPEQLRLLALDPKGRAFQGLTGAPHLLRPPVTDLPEMLEALRSLLRAMEVRDQQRENSPCVVLLIDELADLIFQGGDEITKSLTRLVQRGREAGIHVVAATQRPSSALMSGLLRANFPLRLVGKVVSASDARVATGRGGTDAHLLSGRGDFLAVGGGGEPIRFQVAFVSEEELRVEVRNYQPPLNGFVLGLEPKTLVYTEA
ncbi:MAG: DNA translocase FtsK [Chloroflexota bacterium]|nr:DNA translocase FtsK [Chloroflexota bacterium]